jgi:hypothetical protein
VNDDLIELKGVEIHDFTRRELRATSVQR